MRPIRPDMQRILSRNFFIFYFELHISHPSSVADTRQRRERDRVDKMISFCIIRQVRGETVDQQLVLTVFYSDNCV